MTTETYDERLRTFAEGKRLGRLAKAIRNPRDARCDACGSTLPTTLFALRDSVGGHHYFVGQNCLAAMLEMGLVARARYRQSAEKAYRDEMEVRRNEAGAEHAEPSPSVIGKTRSERSRPDRTLFIIETEDRFEVVAQLEDGRRRVTGRAQEPRWRRDWTRDKGGLVLLERAQKPRPRALAICVLKAYGQALSLWRNDGNRRTEGAGKEVKTCQERSTSLDS